jgi:hypothetical protein
MLHLAVAQFFSVGAGYGLTRRRNTWSMAHVSGRNSRLPPAFISVMMLLPALGAQNWEIPMGPQPPARGWHTLAYDSARNRTVLFGGQTLQGLLGLFADTWEFNGAYWQAVATTTSPTARFGHAVAYDSSRGRLVLFGGQTAVGIGGDTWEYDGTNWSRILPAASPPARTRHALAYDSVRGRTVLFGGSDNSNVRLSDTWEYDGTTWNLVPSAVAPPYADHAMAYDSARGRVVLFGGWSLQGLAADTLEYDGTGWTHIITTLSPPARWGHSLTYDAVRRRTVLFGGAGAGSFTDTWEYNGGNWLQVPTSVAPETRFKHAAVFDSARGCTMLFGGNGSLVPLDDTWRLDGTRWVRLVSPAGLFSQAASYDLTRERTVLFGGRAWFGSSVVTRDTWECDGTTWATVATSGMPAARMGHALAYDSALHRTVLFGGAANGSLVPCLGDTWEYDGTNWNQVQTTPPSPPARSGHGLAYDMARRRIVLFGGSVNSGSAAVVFADTWELDGKVWKQISVPTSPQGRTGHRMAYDVGRGRTVLFGGWTNTFLADTWEYNGATWVQVTTPISPPGRVEHSLVYDIIRGKTVLFGGYNGSALADDWEYNGLFWTQVTTSSVPPGRFSHSAAYDLRRQRVLLFGGVDSASTLIPLGDTWEFTAATGPTWARYGVGCRGSNGTPALDTASGSLPALGSSLGLQLTALPSQPGLAVLFFGYDIRAWNGIPLPFALDANRASQCLLWIGPAPGADILLAHSGNAASFTVTIPANSGLAGLTVAVQALVMDPGAASGLGAVSNGGIMHMY